ncbi:hypothetical protein KAFR_0H01300 [Kazachstania africana CBS 2517]|uniref:Uncharacterized protein n=1 Tax=Kazachstania africana (strain ATCC 22294 / BCRC 22015 / CBS 2517 / CECT 1963 / NBRC 1671 / NRRL Y-8276) TaxID=1071382 RepID=H2AYY4_KAZAF|nr:hypothetical protein KAFR_0H01300 [Kazachstania africana CBS 2517]CCF59540.1 hypothetical protein KAFR_0H01300 [Kazachstania africana CBS 2517]
MSIENGDNITFHRVKKPRLIILIRHGESASNKDKTVNEYISNHTVPLTKEGWKQAHSAGAALLKVLNLDNRDLANKISEKYTLPESKCRTLPLESYGPICNNKDENIVFYTSPYKRTRETLKGVLNVLDEYNELNCNVRPCEGGSYQPYGKQKYAEWPMGTQSSGDYKNDISSFTVTQKAADKTYVKYRIKDEPRIREQDFGNYQDINSMQDVLKKRASYGHFFFRFPQGESAADVYDRVASFQETMFRHFEERQSKKLRDVIVLVTHGIFLRVFLMKWFRWTYEEFESFTNVPNGCMIVMELDEQLDRYILRTKLPKWTNCEE